jgi:hypothetical protein
LSAGDRGLRLSAAKGLAALPFMNFRTDVPFGTNQPLRD